MTTLQIFFCINLMVISIISTNLHPTHLEVDTQSVIYITQSHFNAGSYIITVPGRYVLKHDIVFNPKITNEADHQYVCNAAISIACDNVVLDLNGKNFTIESDYRMCFSHISCENTRHTVIKNGSLQGAVQYGIWGKNNATIDVHDLEITQWQHAAIYLDECISGTIRNVIISQVKKDNEYSRISCLDDMHSFSNELEISPVQNTLYGIYIGQKTIDGYNETIISLENIMVSYQYGIQIHTLCSTQEVDLVGIYVNNAHTMAIKNCSIVGLKNCIENANQYTDIYGIVLKSSQDCQILDCEVLDCCTQSGCIYGIAFVGEFTKNSIENCIALDCYLNQATLLLIPDQTRKGYCISNLKSDNLIDYGVQCTSERPCGFYACVFHKMAKENAEFKLDFKFPLKKCRKKKCYVPKPLSVISQSTSGRNQKINQHYIYNQARRIYDNKKFSTSIFPRLKHRLN